MNSSVAFCFGSTVIYWNGIIIACGVLAGFLLSYALYTAHSGRGEKIWTLMALSMFFGIILSRVIHFWFNREQYQGFADAFTNYAHGSFWLPGAVAGVFLAAFLVKRLKVADSAWELLDACAPGMAFQIAAIRFSALFSNFCRGKYPVESFRFQRYPFAAPMTDAAGNTTYHLATFFIMAILMLLAMIALLVFYFTHHADHMKPPCSRYGNVARLFLVIYCCFELVLDSTRSDATYLSVHLLQGLNNYLTYISLTQTAAAVCLILLMRYYMRCSVKANRKQKYHYALWGGFAAGLTGTGLSEYLVQRYTGSFPLLIAVQSIFVLASAACICLAAASCRAGENADEEELI